MPYSPLRRLLDELEGTLDRLDRLESSPASSTLLVAFSGGADSLALLAGLAHLAPARRLTLLAFHLDHALDEGSAVRAGAATRLAAAFGVPLHLRRRAVAAERRRGESLEEAARRVRYADLEACRAGLGAAWSLTAHHRDDQVETLLLRLLGGSRWPGLAAIAPLHGRVARPLLALRRDELAAAVRELAPSGLVAVTDPTNRDLALARNRVRHLLLPHLIRRDPDLVDAAASLAAGAGRAWAALGRRLAPALDPRGIAIDWWRSRPAAVRRESLRLVADRGRSGPGLRETAWRELERQAAQGGGAFGCDAGEGFRFEARGGRLRLMRRPESPREFSYTVAVPGFVEIPEARGRLRIRPLGPDETAAPVDPAGGSAACLRREPPRLGWSARSRRPGDRLRPAGAPGSRKLKELLIDRKVPAAERSLLPLLCSGEEIVWVPGVAVAEGWRARPGEPAWIAEWERT